jgi:hypothetical protein
LRFRISTPKLLSACAYQSRAKEGQAQQKARETAPTRSAQISKDACHPAMPPGLLDRHTAELLCENGGVSSEYPRVGFVGLYKKRLNPPLAPAFPSDAGCRTDEAQASGHQAKRCIEPVPPDRQPDSGQCPKCDVTDRSHHWIGAFCAKSFLTSNVSLESA